MAFINLVQGSYFLQDEYHILILKQYLDFMTFVEQ